jgi:hypothetical protein
MTDITIHLRLVGLLLLGLAFMGLFLPRRFGWQQDTAGASLLNRQIFYVHNSFIVLLLAMFGLLALTCARPLLEPHAVARAVLGGLAAFWFVRLLVQWFVYDRRLWHGKRFETTMHVLFTGVWVYFTATFAIALWLNLNGRMP